MIVISENDLEIILEEKYKEGIARGIKLMESKLIHSCENGNPIEINGRAWFLKSDIQNLRDIMDDLEEV